MADELVQSRSVIGLLDGGLRLWVVARSALARIILLSGLVIGVISVLLPVGDLGGYARFSLLLAMFIIGEAAGAVTLHMMLGDGELSSGATWQGVRKHWFAVVLAWLTLTAGGVLLLSWVVESEMFWLPQVLLWAGYVFMLSFVSLLLVTAILEESGRSTFGRLRSLTKGFRAKAFGLACLWGLAAVLFATMMAAWLVGLIFAVFAAALGPLQLDAEELDPARWTALLSLGPLMIFAPGSAGIWGLFLIDLSVQREGLDLTRAIGRES